MDHIIDEIKFSLSYVNEHGPSRFLKKFPHYILRDKVVLPDRIQGGITGTEEHKSSADNYWKYEGKTEHSIKPSKISHKLPQSFRRWEGHYEEDESNVYRFNSAYILGKDGILFDSTGRLILDYNGNNTPVLNIHLRRLEINQLLDAFKPTLFNPEQRFSSAFPMIANPNCYYRWVVEYLPKLRGLKKYIRETGDHPQILIREESPDYMKNSLELFGFDRISEWDGGFRNIGSLIFSPHRRHDVDALDGGDYTPHQTGYKWLRESAKNRIKSPQKPNRIFISRQDIKRRHVVNEDEVMDALSERGFKKVTPPKLSFKDNVRIFSNADIITGIHGAGFVDMIWASDPTIIEMIPSYKIRGEGEAFYVLARSLDYEYDYMFTGGSYEEGVEVDVDELCRIVDAHIDGD